ncbi:MAG: DUF3467 domain-containing protein [Nitrospirota bacterium]
MANKPQELKVNLPAQLQAGVYANNLMITHTREEFIMDFSVITPPIGTVSARVITSPGHMKRIITALQENVKRYEAQFGIILQAEEPKGTIGFNA